MAQLFNNDIANRLERADITSARFEIGSVWTVCAFFRTPDTVTDDRGILTKWSTDDEAKAQFFIRIDRGSAPQQVEVATNSATGPESLNFGSIDLDTWYLIIVRNDGTGGVSGMRGTLYNMDGTIDGTQGGQHDGNNSDLTEPVRIGSRDAGNDPMDGDIAYVAYFNTELSTEEEIAYLRNPYSVVFSKGVAGTEFFLPLYGDDSPAVELVHGRNFTVTGSLAKGTNPPVGPFAPFHGPFAAAAAAPASANAVLEFMVPQ